MALVEEVTLVSVTLVLLSVSLPVDALLCSPALLSRGTLPERGSQMLSSLHSRHPHHFQLQIDLKESSLLYPPTAFQAYLTRPGVWDSGCILRVVSPESPPAQNLSGVSSANTHSADSNRACSNFGTWVTFAVINSFILSVFIFSKFSQNFEGIILLRPLAFPTCGALLISWIPAAQAW